MKVEVVLEVNDANIRIVRGIKKNKGFVELYNNNEQIEFKNNTDIDDKIAEIIAPLTLDIYDNTVHMAQKAMVKFVGMKPAERRNFISYLLGIDNIITDVYNEVLDRYNELEKAKARIESKIDDINNYLREH